MSDSQIQRRRLPDDRASVTRHFILPVVEREARGDSLGDVPPSALTPGTLDVYVTVGLYADGAPGELFITAAKQGGTVSGLMDTWARMASLALQHGCPLAAIVAQLRGLRFEPAGWVDGQYTTSLPDMVARWLESRFLSDPPTDSPRVDPPSEAL